MIGIGFAKPRVAEAGTSRGSAIDLDVRGRERPGGHLR
jgi:hypothetical protein